MNKEHVYCPECHKKVRVTLTAAPGHQGQANIPDGPQVVCLDFHDSCADGRCPLFDRPGVVMGVRLARSGLRTEGWETIRALCKGCGEMADLELMTRQFAHCPLCDTTNHVTMVDLEDGEFVTVTEAP